MDPILVDALGKSEVYPSVDYRDRMHGLIIFLHRVLCTTLDMVITSRPTRRLLDRRLAFVGKRFVFGDTGNHQVRPQRTIFSDVGMSATDKYWLVFQLSYVFGWCDEDTVFSNREMCHSMRCAIAQAQLMLLAVKGRRSYTEQELRTIFDRGYIAFFLSLERVRELHYNIQVSEAIEASVPPPKKFKRQERRLSGTDTDDTDEDSDVRGHGYYSHGTYCLTHQHWVSQCVSAGSFGVNCTQAAEASHKLNMHRASLRVRHLDSNRTQASMLKYLCWHSVFEGLSLRMSGPEKKKRNLTCGVKHTFSTTVSTLHGSRLHSMAFQRSFLHREARLAGVELLDLLCEKFRLPKTRYSYTTLNALHFTFGQQLVREDGRTFWSTDSRYLAQSTRSYRRDFLRLKDVVDGDALCCEAVCFVEITNAKRLKCVVDTLKFVVVRFLEPHAQSWERDRLGLPLCPGPFRINNCLWTYARTSSPRRSMVKPCGSVSIGFNTHRHMFGENQVEQHERWQREKHAYYSLVSPDEIVDTMNMCNTFEPGSSNPIPCDWLQTVQIC